MSFGAGKQRVGSNAMEEGEEISSEGGKKKIYIYIKRLVLMHLVLHGAEAGEKKKKKVFRIFSVIK